MAQVNKNQATVKPFEVVPQVPQDFDGAVATNREALRAIDYWKDEKVGAISLSKANEARTMLQKWHRVAEEAQVIIKSYQPSLF